MKVFVYLYALISLFAGLGALGNSGWIAGASLVAASLLGWWAGTGLKGSLLIGDKSQKIGGFVMAAVFLLIAHFLSYNFLVSLFGIEVGGGIWYLIGALVGFFTTNKSDAASASK